ncbi:MAG: TetR/AcrR family transcriptional regulator [bacterium]|nr:TetR/AcrR family transcriptional regulator [bacterium]
MAYRTTPKIAKRKDARRRHLLATATRLFADHGYHAATVPMIVGDAGSSTGSFYFYFRNKEDIFAAVLEGIGERLAAALNEATGKLDDPLERMRAAVEALFLFLATSPGEARILIVESSGLSNRLGQIRRRILDSHAMSVQKALAALAGRLGPLDAAIAARCWVGAVYEAARYWLETPPEQRSPAAEAARTVALFNLRAIGAPNEPLP